MKQALTTLAGLLALTIGMTVAAQDDAVESNADAAAAAIDDLDREGERCISVSRIRDTHVVDDKTVLFYMRGGSEIYRNELRYECRGLERENSFSYRVIANRLCSTDSIRVLRQFGSSLDAGISCGLGLFFPISEEEADFLRHGEVTEIQEEPEAVELPEDDEAD